MDEMLLHHIWKFQKLDQPKPLRTTDGQALKVYHPGIQNHDAGPDFEQARINIGGIEWAGNLEIHVRSSDWRKHNHQKDPAYENVILHVVWEEDEEVQIHGAPVPTLQLKEVVNGDFLASYRHFFNQKQPILCAEQLSTVEDLTFKSMVERAAVERLATKAKSIQTYLQDHHHDWEQTTYHLLLQNFGFSVNKEPFTQLANDLPFSILKRYLHQPLLAEALLFGEAGFLDTAADAYQAELRKEYQYLKKKHQLPNRLRRPIWKFGRMRPANFPTVRLAQLTSFLVNHPHLFQLVINSDASSLNETHRIKVSEYWQVHYDFGKTRSRKGGEIGKETINNLIINTVSPLLAAYADYMGDQDIKDKAIRHLESVKPEINTYTKRWKTLGKSAKHAFDSQGLLGLFKNYCQQRRCLSCSVAHQLIDC